jgi:hypothetical protein
MGFPHSDLTYDAMGLIRFSAPAPTAQEVLCESRKIRNQLAKGRAEMRQRVQQVKALTEQLTRALEQTAEWQGDPRKITQPGGALSSKRGRRTNAWLGFCSSLQLGPSNGLKRFSKGTRPKV